MSKYQFSFASCEGASLWVPLCSFVSICLNFCIYVCLCLNMHMHCVWFRGKVLQRKRIYGKVWLGMEAAVIFLLAEKEEGKKTQTFPHPFSFSFLFSILLSLSSALSFCITYKGSRFLQNEAMYGRYANEINARGLEWDTIYPKSWLSIMAGD